MSRSFLMGGFVGGVVLFVWGAVSWMVLPWHNMTLNTFTDEDKVANVLIANAPVRGIYVYPGEAHVPGLSEDEKAKAETSDLVQRNQLWSEFADRRAKRIEVLNVELEDLGKAQTNTFKNDLAEREAVLLRSEATRRSSKRLVQH